jgi:hypothetical protein
MLCVMARWQDVESAAPELAAVVRDRFAAGRHATLATLRRDGSPRISGTEVEFSGGDVFLGSMAGARKALDLRRDGRFALHSPTVDPPPDHDAWPGEAKLAGTADDVSGPADAGGAHRFRLDITEVVVTSVEADQLVVRSWHEGRGEQTVRRD